MEIKCNIVISDNVGYEDMKLSSYLFSVRTSLNNILKAFPSFKKYKNPNEKVKNEILLRVDSPRASFVFSIYDWKESYYKNDDTIDFHVAGQKKYESYIRAITDLYL